jgi:hypothetical protein
VTTPTPYTRYRDYSQFQADNPNTDLNGSDLDTDFDRIKTTTDSLTTSLATIRKDDGSLKNAIVSPDNLDDTTLALLTTHEVRGDWESSEAYVAGDMVRYGGVNALEAGTDAAGAVQLRADLRAMAAKPPVVNVAGGTAVNDGWGGMFVWKAGDTTADDGALNIRCNDYATNVGVYKRVYHGAKNAKWWGAKGDGVTDDTDALVAWGAVGGALEIDAGEYLIDTMIAVTVAGTTIVGNGDVTITTDAAMITRAIRASCDDFQIRNIRFDCSASDDISNALQIDGHRYKVSNITIIGGYYRPWLPGTLPGPNYGLYIGSSSGVYTVYEDGVIDNVTVIGGNSGIVIQGARRFKMTRINVIGCGSFGCILGSGVSSYDVTVSDFHAVSCGMYGFSNASLFGGSGVDPRGMEDWTMTNVWSSFCGWRSALDGNNQSIGSPKLGFDITDGTMNGLTFYGGARDCGAGGIEFKGSDFSRLYYNSPKVTNAATTSGNVLTFSSVVLGASPLVYVGMAVSGTNIPADTYVASKTTTTVTLTRDVTGTVSSGATISFSVGDMAEGHKDMLADFVYTSTLSTPNWSQTGFYSVSGGVAATTPNPSTFNERHNLRVLATTKQALAFRSNVHRYPYSIMARQNSATITVTSASPGVVTWVGHGLTAGNTFCMDSTGNVPGGTGRGTVYYVISTGLTADTFQFSTTMGGSAVNTTSTGTGTITGYGGVAYMCMGDKVNGQAGTTGQTNLPLTGRYIERATTNSTASGTTITMSNTDGLSVGMVVFGVNIADGTTIASINAGVSFTLSQAVSGAISNGQTLLMATLHDDGNLYWLCMGGDLSGIIQNNNVGLNITASSNIDAVVSSYGNGYGVSINNNATNITAISDINVRAKVRGARYGAFVDGTGTSSNISFDMPDIEGDTGMFIGGDGGTLDVRVNGGRIATLHPASAYALRLDTGTNTVLLDGGVRIESGVRGLYSSAGTHTIKCGSTTWDCASSSAAATMEFANGGTTATIYWGNSVVYHGTNTYAPVVPGAATVTIHGGPIRGAVTTDPNTTPTKGNVGDRVILSAPSQTAWGYVCTAADPTNTWLPLRLSADISTFTTKTAGYTVVAADDTVLCTTNAFTVTLPTAVGLSGRVFTIKNGNTVASGNNITLATTGGQTIDGTAPGTVAPLAKVNLMSDNANWWTV